MVQREDFPVQLEVCVNIQSKVEDIITVSPDCIDGISITIPPSIINDIMPPVC